MNPPTIPQVVKDAVARWADRNNRHHHETAYTITDTVIIPKLTWDPLNGCWFFWHGNLYVGVEQDGYIHT